MSEREGVSEEVDQWAQRVDVSSFAACVSLSLLVLPVCPPREPESREPSKGKELSNLEFR